MFGYTGRVKWVYEKVDLTDHEQVYRGIRGGKYHIWIKKSGSCKQFSLHMLSKIPGMFEHLQIELASIYIAHVYYYYYFVAPNYAMDKVP